MLRKNLGLTIAVMTNSRPRWRFGQIRSIMIITGCWLWGG